MFEAMVASIQYETVRHLFLVRIEQPQPVPDEAHEDKETWVKGEGELE